MKVNKKVFFRTFFCFLVSGCSCVVFGGGQSITTQSNNGSKGVFNNNTGSGNQYSFSIKYMGDYQNNVQSIGTQVNNYNFSPKPAPHENNRDNFLIYQERYLIATNPTELSVVNVELANWVGDTELFLTITVENPANIPAEKLKVSILRPRSGNRPSETIKFQPSNALIQGKALSAVNAGLFLPQKQSLRLPIGSRTELIENVVKDIPQGYKLLGIGENPSIPGGLCDNAYGSYTTEINRNMYVMNIVTAQLAIALKYDTIFDQHLVRLFPLYLYFGRCYSQGGVFSKKQHSFFKR
ncbi:hypothetical protein [Pantoea sp. SJZ147]|uniref:hypothetical protein n=1 Tax=Pantoea sp. SJZ147 TaxID=2572896 RepID=UPI0011A979F9|nr:hypothetical protein [Pantoea sp. SJZ147]